MCLKHVSLKSESFSFIARTVLGWWKKNMRGAKSPPPPGKIGLKELWIDFRVNKHHRYISAHGIAKALGKINTGCDTNLYLNRMGKRKLGKLPKFIFFIKDISRISNCPNFLSFTMDEIERFVVILYSRTSECKLV